MPAPSTPQTIPDVTEDIETCSGSGLGRSRDNGIFDQIRANDAVYFCFGSSLPKGVRNSATSGSSAPRSPRYKAVLSPVVLTSELTGAREARVRSARQHSGTRVEGPVDPHAAQHGVEKRRCNYRDPGRPLAPCSSSCGQTLRSLCTPYSLYVFQPKSRISSTDQAPSSAPPSEFHRPRAPAWCMLRRARTDPNANPGHTATYRTDRFW